MQAKWIVRGSMVGLALLGVYLRPDSPPGVQASEDERGSGGALVGVRLESRVGVVLDEIPASQRDALADFYLAKPNSFWKERAERQVMHTNYRLTYRPFFYETDPPKGILALPPKELWKITLTDPRPRRVRTSDGHDAVVVNYTYESTLLSDHDSPEVAEPALARLGGVWEEPFTLPLDPEFVYQRTGHACVDEDGYPLRTVDSENTYQFFDQECDVETPDTASCHVTEFPSESCLKALRQKVGKVDTKLRFERLRYSRRKADEVRVGDYTTRDFPDLAVLPENLENNRIVYRYIAPDSCAIEESCVTGTGWRRLLLFDASIKNTGGGNLFIGGVEEGSPYVENNVFVFNECHQHYHYDYYGDFSYGQSSGGQEPVVKRAFCIEPTDRYYNSELTPMTHELSCDNQGLASGWGDTYIAGIECNWIDVSDLQIPAAGLTRKLSFDLNPDDFICEGTPVVDANGEQVFEPSGIIAENGEEVGRPLCEFFPEHDQNNFGQRNVTVPRDGGLVTADCTRSQAGPLRDCGLRERAENIACTPGRNVRLECKVEGQGPAQVVRFCENSAGLGGVTACMYRDALASAIVDSRGWTNVNLTCPVARDSTETGGAYGYFSGPVVPMDRHSNVTCRLR